MNVKFIVFIVSFSLGVLSTTAIINGRSSYWGQFPFYASIQTTDAENNLGSCGGTILNEDWILTSGHCLKGMRKVIIHLGSVSRRSLMEFGRTVHVATWSNFRVHSLYMRSIFNPVLSKNDVALIKMDRPIQFSHTIQPIRLPKSCDLIEHDYAFVMGFGTTNATENSMPNILQWTSLSTVPRKQCKNIPFINMHDSILCGESDANSAMCTGDSGSPIVRYNDGELLGIANQISDPNGCKPGSQQTYTNILAYLTWISKTTGMKLPQCTIF